MSTLKTTVDGLEYRPSIEGQPPRSIAPSAMARTITTTLLVVALIYFLFPVLWVFFASTKNNHDIVSTFGFWFGDKVDWSGNWALLTGWQPMFLRWVGNSIFYSTAAATIGTLLSVSAGYAMAKFRYPGRSVMLGTIMAGLLMPVAILTIPMVLLFSQLGLNNTIWAVIIPCMVSPFGVFLGNVYATTSVPTELLEAARIDGAGEARIFFTMVIRLLAPAMVTIFLFIFVGTWNNFMLPLMMLSSPELKPVTVGLYGMMSYYEPQKGAVMMGALIGVLPLIVLFIFLQRYWQSGLAAGAVKG